jgi:hypothetical protein
MRRAHAGLVGIGNRHRNANWNWHRNWHRAISNRFDSDDPSLSRRVNRLLGRKSKSKNFSLFISASLLCRRRLSARRGDAQVRSKLCVDPMRHDNVLLENRGSHDHNIGITSKYRNDRLTAKFLLGVLMEKRKC